MCLNLLQEKWDIAIILDACRYDIFKKIYKEYLPKGKLEKREGSSYTQEWLSTLFKKYQQIIYVSGHPGINSAGIPWGDWSAKNKFKKIYNAWDKGWDEELGTTNPETVKEYTIRAVENEGNERIISHFVQPHYPYRKAPYKEETLVTMLGDSDKSHLFFKLRKKIGYLIDICHLTFLHWKFRKIIGLAPNSSGEYYWRHYKRSELFQLYEDNLRWVLKEVSELVERLRGCDKKIVITSDHGEAFGEKGEFFHYGRDLKSSAIKIVPFYTIDM